ncbi:hypothetical protein [Deinococcus aquatilis]|jgi:hypothetical protein|uniref:hypothetical protein n=1 Tax=Deinococcus aquatilis TaxID=519440 RepID=UPI00036C85F9|nr:hypothetical protein [Deinococcus aquatilis]
MANRKRAELSLDQNADLLLFQREMLNRNWQSTGTFTTLFEQGWGVPYQAEFIQRQRRCSAIVRYSCGGEGELNLLNVTLHSHQDNQMVALQFDRLRADTLNTLLDSLDLFPEQGVRATLETLAASDLHITVNICDDYFPLEEASLKRLYS